MSRRRPYRHHSADELFHECDWVSSEVPLGQHEADAREYKLEQLHAELTHRKLTW